MSVSDIITLVSLIIAIVAILNDKNRKHLLLKFHIVDFTLFGAAFILINYFVFYENFYDKGIYISKFYYSNFGLNNPKHYAYIISLIILTYFFYKILYSFYPDTKRKNVLKFYQELIESNEVSFLLELIDRYHKFDIIKLIDNAKDHNPDPKNWWKRRFRRESFKEKVFKGYIKSVRFLFPFSWYNKRAYGSAVLHGILNDPAFIILASNQRPYLFAEICSHFKEKKRNAFPADLFKSFLNELVQNKNFWLIKELKESQNNDFEKPEWFYENNKILAALLIDLSVSDVNEVWQPFGNTACDEIEEERAKGYESKMFNEFREEQFLWEYKTYLAIQLLKILVVEALVKKYLNSHFWLYYYRSITDTILTTFEKYPPKDFEEIQTVYHGFIDIMFDNLFLWLHISNDKADVGFFNNILSCLGDVLLAVCNSSYCSTSKKVSYIKQLLSTYCSLTLNGESKKMREVIASTLFKPSMLAKPDDRYYEYLEMAWDQFDKVPHRKMSGLGEDHDYFKLLKEKVIIPLGYDPEKY